MSLPKRLRRKIFTPYPGVDGHMQLTLHQLKKEQEVKGHEPLWVLCSFFERCPYLGLPELENCAQILGYQPDWAFRVWRKTLRIGSSQMTKNLKNLLAATIPTPEPPQPGFKIGDQVYVNSNGSGFVGAISEIKNRSDGQYLYRIKGSHNFHPRHFYSQAVLSPFPS